MARLDKDDVDELSKHYALACKGNKERAFLMALNAGYDFERVVGAFGDDGVPVAWKCLLNGWIDRGKLTDAGRAQLQSGADS